MTIKLPHDMTMGLEWAFCPVGPRAIIAGGTGNFSPLAKTKNKKARD